MRLIRTSEFPLQAPLLRLPPPPTSTPSSSSPTPTSPPTTPKTPSALPALDPASPHPPTLTNLHSPNPGPHTALPSHTSHSILNHQTQSRLIRIPMISLWRMTRAMRSGNGVLVWSHVRLLSLHLPQLSSHSPTNLPPPDPESRPCAPFVLHSAFTTSPPQRHLPFPSPKPAASHRTLPLLSQATQAQLALRVFRLGALLCFLLD
jgi:hypothetical protein